MTEPAAGSDRSAASRTPENGDASIQFFADEPGSRESVFGSVDQSDVLSRLGDGAIEDDYADPFFDHSLLSSQVPHRSVDVGIRTVVGGEASSRPSATTSGAPDDDRLGATVSPALTLDAVARRRFILEGPASLASATG